MVWAGVLVRNAVGGTSILHPRQYSRVIVGILTAGGDGQVGVTLIVDVVVSVSSSTTSEELSAVQRDRRLDTLTTSHHVSLNTRIGLTAAIGLSAPVVYGT